MDQREWRGELIRKIYRIKLLKQSVSFIFTNDKNQYISSGFCVNMLEIDAKMVKGQHP